MQQVLVMMLGELEYEDIYYPNQPNVTLEFYNNQTMATGTLKDNIQSQSFRGTAHVMIILFVFVVSMVVMNLLVGLAVADIQASHHKPALIGALE